MQTKQMASPWLLIIFFLSLLCFHGRSQNTKPQEPEYECVDIYKQPSLQHSKLKNHRIQMRPSDEVLAMLSGDTSAENLSDDEMVAEFDIPEEGCPQGQVPIHKPRNLNHTEKPFQPINGYGTVGQHAAIMKKIDAIPWRGASAWISIYQPKLRNKEQFSMALIWLNTENQGERTSAQFGWAVIPELYGDYRTRLTAYWSPDKLENGCYNTKCKGFVQIDRRIFLGAGFSKTSVVGGTQFKAFFSINQDPKTKNLLLTVGKIYIGYWPEELLPYFFNGAEAVIYGGFTNAPSENIQLFNIVSPPMGNGNKPLDEEVDLKHTCYMHSLKYVTPDYKSVDIDSNKVTEVADAGKCYDVIYFDKLGQYGQAFTFGGPGGYCDV
ncbi:Neprosin activation peptide [Arabidopsis thaliana x Arabidopsis arenosa]|uniref:Neprosin activation peptide n=1 Tax=Arabidopsis thaliana x Arabidopsis arenosa TaxID=1240361 RepID=A0A8T1XFD2_9BRAS|nr:Neprosin activation peptide [Arabidopsis thaliana x Arabidopsis arenosa]